MMKKTNSFMTAALLALTVCGVEAAAQNATAALRAGCAKAAITPQKAVEMAAYSRDIPSRGVHDPLYVRVLVLEVGENRLALIACDLAGYSSKRIVEEARNRYRVGSVLISASHTHSGPDLRKEPGYAERVERTILESLDQAVEGMFPARLAAGYRSFPQLGFMRLILREDGRAHAPWYNRDPLIPSHNPYRVPFGPVDPEVGVIRIDDQSGIPRVILLNYACHATSLARNFQISADYPGQATRLVEETIGGGVISMFVNGGSGNIAPLLRGPSMSRDGQGKADYEPMKKLGSLLAAEVIKLAESLRPREPKDTSLKIMEDSLQFCGRFNKDLSYDIHFTTAIINGEIAIASFPGEPFVKFQLDWKQFADVAHPFFFGYTFNSQIGDNPHYVPDIRSAAFGGYGADSSSLLIEVGAGEAIMSRHLENAYRLLGIMRDEPGTP